MTTAVPYPPGLIPYSTDPKPAVVQVNPRTWDVTEPFRWQLNPQANRSLLPADGVPVEGVQPPPKTHGYHMAGGRITAKSTARSPRSKGSRAVIAMGHA